MKSFLSVECRYASTMGAFDPVEPHQGKGFQTMTKILLAMPSFTQSPWKGQKESLHRSTDMIFCRIRDAKLAKIMDFHAHLEMVPEGDHHYYCKRFLDGIINKTKVTTGRRIWLI